jgi:DNA-directed RNA polymerase subunit RPC12/RpoP
MVNAAEKEEVYACPKCESSNVEIYEMNKKKYLSCRDCGYEEVLA